MQPKQGLDNIESMLPEELDRRQLFSWNKSLFIEFNRKMYF